MPEFDSTVSFRDVPGWPGYVVGSNGSVWSCRVNRKPWIDPACWHELKPVRFSNDYRMVCLHDHSRSWQVQVHRLVLLAFRGPCPDGWQTRHLDGDRGNNRLENLAWGTRAENYADRARHGREARGERVGTSRLTEATVREIRRLYAAGATKRGLGRLFGVNGRMIDFIVRRVFWKHVT